MRVVILAAGYATRLYPLTRDFPKALLEVGSQTLLDHLIDSLSVLPLSDITLVSNARFAHHFESFRPGDIRLRVNESTHEGDRLGAVGDMVFGLKSENGMPDEQILVVAGDNIFDFSLEPMWHRHLETGHTTLCAWHNPVPHDRTRRGNVEFDHDGLVTRFAEKPAQAFSPWSTAPIYCFRPADLDLAHNYLAQGGNADAPGHFIEWLSRQVQVGVWEAPVSPTDIGTHEALAEARARYTAQR